MNKYRAWDKKHKVMMCEIDIYHDGKIGFAYDYSKKAYGRKFDKACQRWMAGDDYFWTDEGFDLMQSTGFQDNDGNEIYDGDIVRLGYGIPPTSVDLVIEWTKDETINDVPVCGWWMRNLIPKGTSSMISDLYDLAVIGNKFENPELIRKHEVKDGER